MRTRLSDLRISFRNAVKAQTRIGVRDGKATDLTYREAEAFRGLQEAIDMLRTEISEREAPAQTRIPASPPAGTS